MWKLTRCLEFRHAASMDDAAAGYRRIWRLGLGLMGLLVCGCGDDGALDGPSPDGDAGCGARSESAAVTTGIATPVPVEGSACDAVVTAEAEGDGLHVAECSRITYATNPPSSGSHYPSWAAFTVFERPVARGYWVHSIEHGAVAFLYDCDDCDDEIQAAKELIAELPEDPRCVGQATPNRILMTPDPLLDVPWAAAAWGVTLRARCFEPEVFRAFVSDHYGRAPENLCAAGGTF